MSVKNGDECRRGSMLPAMVDLASSERTLAAALDLFGDDADGISDDARGTSQAAMVAAGRYPGGKNGAGVFQRLINMMPPHRAYVEPFLGSGAVMLRKRPAVENIGIDRDASVIAAHAPRPGYRFLCADALEWIEARDWSAEDLIYADPPYLGTARSSHRRLYRCELLGSAGHERLLGILKSVPARVMISGYESPLYRAALAGWNRSEFQAMTRGGAATEVVWFNFAEPAALHDYSFLGSDFHDRLRIARKIQRWTAKLAALPALERNAILAALSAVTPPVAMQARPGEGGLL